MEFSPFLHHYIFGQRKVIPNNIGNLFDPNQEGSFAMVLRLSLVSAFVAMRLALGLTALVFTVLK